MYSEVTPYRQGALTYLGGFSVKMYAKMKELGPMGGVPGMPPARSGNAVFTMPCVYSFGYTVHSAPAIPISPMIHTFSFVFNTDMAIDHDQRSVIEA